MLYCAVLGALCCAYVLRCAVLCYIVLVDIIPCHLGGRRRWWQISTHHAGMLTHCTAMCCHTALPRRSLQCTAVCITSSNCCNALPRCHAMQYCCTASPHQTATMTCHTGMSHCIDVLHHLSNLQLRHIMLPCLTVLLSRPTFSYCHSALPRWNATLYCLTDVPLILPHCTATLYCHRYTMHTLSYIIILHCHCVLPHCTACSSCSCWLTLAPTLKPP